MNDKPRRRWRPTTTTAALLVAFASLLVTVVTLPVAIRATDAANKAQNAVDLVNEQRAEARLVACDKDNRDATLHNGLADATIDVLVGVRAGITDPAALEFFSQHIETLTNARAMFRDCSPAGIDAYYAGGKT